MPDQAGKTDYGVEWGKLDVLSETRLAQNSPRRILMEQTLKDHYPKLVQEKNHQVIKWEQEMARNVPDDSYRGPRLENPPTPDCMENLVEHYLRDSSVPLHAHYLVCMLERLRDMLEQTPRVVYVNSLSGSHKKLVVVGDLHGQLPDLLQIFMENGYPDPEGTQYVFNGDFVDRGPCGVEVTSLIFGYKLLYPGSVHLNRGNHENPDLNVHYGFFEEIVNKYSSAHLMQLYHQVFFNLPLATILDNRYIVLHGGLSRDPNMTISKINQLPRISCNVDDPNCPLVDILWNDPDEAPGIQRGPRGGHTALFGPDVSAHFLGLNRLERVIRSHQVPSNNQGFAFHHGGRVITVFSASNYCGLQGNQGAVLIIEEPPVYKIKQYMAPELWVLAKRSPRKEKVKHVDVREAFLSQLRDLIFAHRHALRTYWSNIGTSHITVVQWAEGLRRFIKHDLDFTVYARQLASVQEDGLIDYRKFLNRFSVRVNEEFGGWQKIILQEMHSLLRSHNFPISDLLKLLDPASDGFVRSSILQTAFQHLGLDLSIDQAQALLDPLADRNGRVTVESFIRSLRLVRPADGAYDPDVEEVIRTFARWIEASPRSLVESFQALDLAGHGHICYDDFVAAVIELVNKDMEHLHFLDSKLLQKVFDTLDRNKSNKLNFLDFIDAMVPSEEAIQRMDNQIVQQVASAVYSNRMTLKEAFFSLDVDGDGMLQRADFEEGIGLLCKVDPDALTPWHLRMMANELFKDRDRIGWHHFLDAFTLLDSPGSPLLKRSESWQGSPPGSPPRTPETVAHRRIASVRYVRKP